MKVTVYTFCQSILARVDICIRISLHNYLVGQIKVTVFTFCQPILASVDNCIRIALHNYIVGQMKVIVYTFCQPILASTDNCNLILIAQLYRRANGSNCIYILSTISCKC